MKNDRPSYRESLNYKIDETIEEESKFDDDIPRRMGSGEQYKMRFGGDSQSGSSRGSEFFKRASFVPKRMEVQRIEEESRF